MKYSPATGPPVGPDCEHCGQRHQVRYMLHSDIITPHHSLLEGFAFIVTHTAFLKSLLLAILISCVCEAPIKKNWWCSRHVANQIKLGCLDRRQATVGVIKELLLQDLILSNNINIIQSNNTFKYKIHCSDSRANELNLRPVCFFHVV